ncbi:MAG: hypothetical protein KA524_07535 [Nitrosomonas sp.]|nr:hypothetical protein [Nitrosomonas sp.]MBP6076035.1 hypothetical protein [Nitrosomonas sp.]
MGYKFHSICHDTLYDFHVAFAQECFKLSGGGLTTTMINCTADPGGYVIMQSYNVTNGTSGTPWNFTPQAVTCDPSLLNQTALMWELALILIAGFTIRAIIKAFQ